MMVDYRGRRRVMELQLVTAAEVIGAINEDRGAIIGGRENVICAVERHSSHQKEQPAWHGIRIHTDHVVAQGRQHAGERHLQTDAVSVGRAWPMTAIFFPRRLVSS